MYVDDIFIAGKKLERVNKAKEELKQEYDMTDGGELHYILGMQVERKRENEEIFLHQRKNINEFLKELLGGQKVSTPMDPKQFFSHEQSPKI